MENTVDFVVKLTKDAIPQELAGIKHFVKLGGQVKLDDEILEKNIRNSRRIAFCTINNNNDAIGCAVIKVPQASYHRKVFEKAGVPELQDKYPFEIGYCVTASGHEGKGICRSLIQELLQAESLNLFATTKSPAMKHLFTSFGFTVAGQGWYVDGETENITQLYIYAHK